MKRKISKVIAFTSIVGMLCSTTSFAQGVKRSALEYKDYSISTLLLEDFHKELIEQEKKAEKERIRKNRDLSKANPNIPQSSRVESVSGTNRGGTFSNIDFTQLALPENIMPIEHQKYLYDLCVKRDLDYIKTLALIKLESNFNPNNISRTNDYGYMQINRGNHNHLSKNLNTQNDGLNPYINMNWGTYMLSNLYDSYAHQGLTGERLDRSTWSAYNKGVAGFKRHGEATGYINKLYKEEKWIKQQLGL